MPGQDQYVKLPDGSYVHVPATATPAQLSQLRGKLSDQFNGNLQTGAGMEDRAEQQARPKPGELPGVPNNPIPTGNAGTQREPLITPQPGEGIADTMRRAVEMGRNVTPQQRATAEDEGIKRVPTVLGAAGAPAMLTGAGEAMDAGVPGILKLGRGLIGGAAGGTIGAGAGAKAGGLFGPMGAKVGGTLGGIGGGMLGGGLAAGLERTPATSAMSMRGQPGPVKALPFGIQRFIPESMVPTGEPGTPTNPGPFSSIPARMPSSSLRSAAGAAPTGASSVAGTRSLVLTPSEAQSESVMQRIATKRASERGMQFAGGMTPREGRSVPKSAMKIPEEEYPGPRESVKFPDADDGEE